MNYFKPPTTEYTDQYEVIRFNLTWNLCLALCILLSLLSIANFYNDNYTSLMNIMEEGGHSKIVRIGTYRYHDGTIGRRMHFGKNRQRNFLHVLPKSVS